MTVGSVMEDSQLPLHKWLLAFGLMLSSKKGIGAHQPAALSGCRTRLPGFWAIASARRCGSGFLAQKAAQGPPRRAPHECHARQRKTLAPPIGRVRLSLFAPRQRWRRRCRARGSPTRVACWQLSAGWGGRRNGCGNLRTKHRGGDRSLLHHLLQLFSREQGRMGGSASEPDPVMRAPCPLYGR